ncbi:GLE1-domain-containing protein [Annulohypoxylon maeteangense]|uniref:GLE1-domain-containing protein n=1 Tax=Annulohypoxylon maeteangense TaxID=1927788 RepID=UPI002007770A|nr:GLE1-domain-containing protein [Annulohypoxylon maeteangense]KAI0881104.1 GLE1-domain-containing protein [Annulohypoxylon maeteangense]
MSGSSPAPRRSRQWSSPDRRSISSLLTESRNSPLSHQDALAAAQAEHDRVREAAIRVYQDYESQQERRRLLEQQERILQQQKQEEERIRTEERLRAEEIRLRELKLKTVPKLPPEPPAPVTEVNGSATSQNPTQPTLVGAKLEQTSTSKTPQFGLPQPALTNGLNGHANGTSGTKPTQPTIQSMLSQPLSQPNITPQAQVQPSSIPSPFSQPVKPTPTQQNGFPAAAPAKPSVGVTKDRYIEIHQNLKRLRESLLQQSKSNPALKQRMGDMRRELRKNMGQLVSTKSGNRKQNEAIQALLNEAISGAVPSQLVDPSDYITDKREPVQGALHNEPQLPSLFLYLLNHFSKAVINQFINECGAQPTTADPIGVTVAIIFSKDVYLWRGKTLIDILMAKFRVVCPVLFGYYGNEKTEQGRLRLGWKKSPAGYIPEQQHSDRMKGLGAGYAAIALRNFGKTKSSNPWPPTNYWTAMARIVNTPPADISETQFVVLRAMIEASEEKFIQFYGNAGIAALRKALVEFPNKAVNKTPGASGLEVLAQILKRDIGLEL